MNYIKNVSFSILYIIGFILILTFILTLFSYFNIFSDKLVSIFKILIPIISLFIGGYYLGKRSNKKGWLEGLKLGFIFLVLLIIFEFLALDIDFKIKNIIYYLIIISSTSFGSIIGINKNIVENN
ncbi:MAG: TIGR04086 family membrane protein [Bacilli bacterium]|nr:TIGR04086 family membrane protein [Bacilli bacterium]